MGWSLRAGDTCRLGGWIDKGSSCEELQGGVLCGWVIKFVFMFFLNWERCGQEILSGEGDWRTVRVDVRGCLSAQAGGPPGRTSARQDPRHLALMCA